ncbi:uncharacterized protein LOC103994557 [Musa acuminata AAA Group]|uniref:uncharacterized protein LOC103994557 n=1 Tax=Musa acuminata AAA Group TaxID=214697 RepID=UPI0031CDC6BA
MSGAMEDCGMFAVDCVVKRSKKDDRTNETVLDAEKAKFGAPCCDFRPCDRSSSCLEAEKVLMKGEGNSWMEAEMVWEELIAREGLFWFGSFWGIAD